MISAGQKKYLPLTMQENIKNLANWIIDAFFSHWVLISGFVSGFFIVIGWMFRNFRKGRGLFASLKYYLSINSSVKSLEQTMKDGFNKVIDNQTYLQYQINFQNEVAQMPMWKANAGGQCIYANEAYCKLFDMEFSELRGDGWLNTIADSNLDKTLRLWQGAINARTQSCIEYDAKTMFGTKRVKAIFNVYVDNNGFIEFQGSTQLVREEEIKKECK